MGFLDILFIVIIVVVVVAVVLVLLNRWAARKMGDQQEVIERTKTTTSIYVIDKKKTKMQNANFPKAVYEQLPRWHKLMKVHLVKAKIGPQITTLICDKNVFEVLPVKKSVHVDLAGMYIVSMKGMKTKHEMAALRKERKGGEEKRSLLQRILRK